VESERLWRRGAVQVRGHRRFWCASIAQSPLNTPT